jgi:hypothetical protein
LSRPCEVSRALSMDDGFDAVSFSIRGLAFFMERSLDDTQQLSQFQSMS